MVFSDRLLGFDSVGMRMGKFLKKFLIGWVLHLTWAGD
jgi:hypothetical protein